MENICTAVINAKIVTEKDIINDGVLIIKNGRIDCVSDKQNAQIPSFASIIDAGGCYVGPGFIDIHVHGANGKNVCFDIEAAEHFLKHGTTSLLATPSYTQNFEQMLSAIRSVKELMKQAATIKGINFEGPYINADYGAFAERNAWKGSIDSSQYTRLADEAGDLAKIWTVAPEREGLLPFLKYCTKLNPNVIFSAGHSKATPGEIRALGKYRPKLQTHFGCATGQIPAPAGTRSAGPDEYFLVEKDTYCELICDSLGIHVNPDMQKLLVHCKGFDHIILVTDSTEYQNVQSNSIRNACDLNFDNNGDLAGSKLTMNLACRNVMKHTNCSVRECFMMASLNPARLLGWDKDIGSVEAGKIADLVFVDDEFNVKKVILGGKECNF